MAKKRDPWVPLRLGLPFSEKINSVSIGAEMLYVRLLAQCDDSGNYWGSPKQILALLCSLRWEKGEVQESQIRDWRDDLVRAGLVQIYEVAGREYLHLIAVKKGKRKDVLPDIRFPLTPTASGVPGCGPDAGRMGDDSGPLDVDVEEEEDIDAENKKARKVTFGGGKFAIPNEILAKWKEAHPKVDVDAEIIKAEAWYVTNPARQKKNHGRFLTNWLSNAKPSQFTGAESPTSYKDVGIQH